MTDQPFELPPHVAKLQEAIADIEAQRKKSREAHQSLKELRCTATAPRRVVAVTAAYGGEITEIKFPTSAYKKLPPAELASAVSDTIKEAQEMVLDAAAELITPALPAQFDARKMLRGEFEISDLIPEGESSHPIVQDLRRKWASDS